MQTTKAWLFSELAPVERHTKSLDQNHILYGTTTALLRNVHIDHSLNQPQVLNHRHHSKAPKGTLNNKGTDASWPEQGHKLRSGKKP